MAKKISTGRPRGHIRQRGNSFQVLVYAGLDPLTGKEIRLTGSTSTEPEAKALLKQFRAQVDDQRAPKTKASFRAAMDAWLRVLDVEETTRESYEQYARNHLYPAFGDEPISRITAQLLEAFYAELRRCSQRCGSRPAGWCSSVRGRLCGSDHAVISSGVATPSCCGGAVSKAMVASAR